MKRITGANHCLWHQTVSNADPGCKVIRIGIVDAAFQPVGSGIDQATYKIEARNLERTRSGTIKATCGSIIALGAGSFEFVPQAKVEGQLGSEAVIILQEKPIVFVDD